VDLLRELAEPFDRMTPAAASSILDAYYGVAAAELERLDTERDDTFRVTTATATYVLKAAHPDDDPLYVNLQTAAMSFAAELDPELPLQRLLLTRDGEVEPVIEHGGRDRTVRLLTWLEGTPLHLVSATGGQLALLGDTLGRLSEALSTFDHPAAHREFVWDAAQLPLIRSLADEYPGTDAAWELYERTVVPVLETLPRQVIHNDFHLGNVLVDPDSEGFVAGVIDFGDVVYTARVVDLAVAISYLFYPGGHSPAELDQFVAAFETRVPLRDDEKAALPGLIAARFAQRILINRHLERGHPGDRGSSISSTESTRAALAAWLDANATTHEG
jgi:Ser/Thr protein kinase RdoA (MazF antagonist)